MNKFLMIYMIIKECFFQDDPPPSMEGCLNIQKTTKDGIDQYECSICDSLGGYVKIDKFCQLNKIDNCLISFNQEQCYQCESGYFLTNQLRCVSIKQNKHLRMRNCNEYSKIDDCKVCNRITYKKNGICMFVNKQINHCTINKTIRTCETCDMRLPSYNNTYCEPVDDKSFENCLYFTHPISCTKCKPGFKLEENFFLKNLKDYYQKFFYHLVFLREKYFDVIFNTPVCNQEYQIENCKTLKEGNKCQLCNNGYVLSPDETQCFIKPLPPVNPLNRIPNCYRYPNSNYEECEICLEGFYLVDNKTKCKSHIQGEEVLDPNCDLFSQSNKSICIYCKNDYYLSTSVTPAVCIKRNVLILNCEFYSREKDKCVSCYNGYLFHSSNSKCSKIIENCPYDKHDVNQILLKCIECIDGYYLENQDTMCINANNSLEGCVKYKSGFECKQCQTGYYLSQGRCKLHDEFYHCKDKSITEKNKCIKCIEEGVYTKIVSNCEQLEDRDIVSNQNCNHFNELKQCIGCEANYVVYNNQGISCVSKTGCIKIENDNNLNNCIKCMSGYYNYDGICVAKTNDKCLYPFSQNSTSSQFKFIGMNPCELCNENKYYQVFDSGFDVYKCISINSGAPVANCLQFGIGTTGYICMECRRGYTYNVANNTCDLIDTANILGFDGASEKTYSQVSSTIHWTNSSTKPNLQQYCQQVSEDLQSCLRCKSNSYPYYTSSILRTYLTNTAIQKQFKYFNNVYDDSSKSASEHYFLLKNPQVDQCMVPQTNNNHVNVFDFRLQGRFDSKNYDLYSCKYSPLPKTNDETQPTYNHDTLEIIYNVDEAVKYTGGNYKEWDTLANRKPLCSVQSVGIPNCLKYSNDLQLDLDFEARFFLSCYECNPNYTMISKLYKTRLQIDRKQDRTFNENTFDWLQTTCELDSYILQNDRVQNCHYYVQEIINGVLLTQCKSCNPKYTPTMQDIPYKCPSTDPEYDSTTLTRCKLNFKCSKHLVCVRQCPSTCSSTQYCDEGIGTCVEKDCCSPLGVCSGTSTCSDDKYCFHRECKPKCDCLNGSDNFNIRCDATTNYECVPLLCERAIGQTIAERKLNKIEFDNNTQGEMNANHTYTRELNWQAGMTDQKQILYPASNVNPSGGTYFDVKYQKACQTYHLDGYNFTRYDNGTIEKNYVDKEMKIIHEYTSAFNATRQYTDLNDPSTLQKEIHSYTNGTIKTQVTGEQFYTELHNGNLTTYYESSYQATAGMVKKEEVISTGVIVEYYSDGSRKETYLNGTTATFATNQDVEILYPLDPIIQKKVILAASPNIHTIHYENTDWYKQIDMTDPDNQTGYYDSPTETTITQINFDKNKNMTMYSNGSQLDLIFATPTFHNYYPVSSNKNDYQKIFLDLTEEVIDPNISTHTKMYKQRREYYVSNALSYYAEQFFDNEAFNELLATKTTKTNYQQYEFPGIANIWGNSTHYVYLYNNNTVQIQIKATNEKTSYHSDGTKINIKPNNDVYTYDKEDTYTLVTSAGVKTTVNQKGETTTYNNDVLTKNNNVKKIVGIVGSDQTYILNDDIEYQGEKTPIIYKKKLTDGKIIIKAKDGTKYITYTIDGSKCYSIDNEALETGDDTSDFVFITKTQQLTQNSGSFSYSNLLNEYNSNSLSSLPVEGCLKTTFYNALDKTFAPGSRRLQEIQFGPNFENQQDDQNQIIQAQRFLADPFTDTGTLPQKTRTFNNGDVVVWTDFNNQWERIVTFQNTTKLEITEQTSDKKRVMKTSANIVLFTWDFTNLQYIRAGYNPITMTSSVVAGGTKYSYSEYGESLSITRFDNFTEKLENTSENIEIFYHITQEIIQIEKSVKTHSLPEGKITLQPMNIETQFIDGTITKTQDLMTKITTEVDSTKPSDYTKYFPNNELEMMIGDTKYNIYNNNTVLSRKTGEDLMIQKDYKNGFLADEHYQEIQFTVSTGVKKTIFTNSTYEKEYIEVLSATNENTKFRNGTMQVKTSSGYVLTHSDGSVYNYDSGYNLISQAVSGVSKTWDSVEQNYSYNTATHSIKEFQDGRKQSLTLAGTPSTLTYFDNKIENYIDYLKKTVSYTGSDTNWKVDIDKEKKKITINTLGTFEKTLDTLKYTNSAGVIKDYRLSDCARNTTISNELLHSSCEKIYFGNGDTGFYYTDEALIFKPQGDLWYMNHGLNHDIFHILNWHNPMMKYYRRGKLERQQSIGYDLLLESEERIIQFANNTAIIDNLITNQRKYFDNYQQANQILKYTDNGYDVTEEKIGANTKVSYQKLDGSYFSQDAQTIEYYVKDQFKITKNISTGVITKVYDYHPYIIQEILNGNEKTIEYKERFAKWRGYKKLTYNSASSIPISIVNNQDQTKSVDTTQDTYFIPFNATTFSKVQTDQVGYWDRTEQYASDKVTEKYIYSNQTGSEQLKQKIFEYQGYKVTEENTQRIIEIGSEYKITVPNISNPEIRTVEKLTATTYTWNYAANKVHHFTPYYSGFVKRIDYPNDLIIADRQEFFNNGKIYTTQQITGQTPGDLTIKGSIKSTDFATNTLQIKQEPTDTYQVNTITQNFSLTTPARLDILTQCSFNYKSFTLGTGDVQFKAYSGNSINFVDGKYETTNSEDFNFASSSISIQPYTSATMTSGSVQVTNVSKPVNITSANTFNFDTNEDVTVTSSNFETINATAINIQGTNYAITGDEIYLAKVTNDINLTHNGTNIMTGNGYVTSQEVDEIFTNQFTLNGGYSIGVSTGDTKINGTNLQVTGGTGFIEGDVDVYGEIDISDTPLQYTLQYDDSNYKMFTINSQEYKIMKEFDIKSIYITNFSDQNFYVRIYDNGIRQYFSTTDYQPYNLDLSKTKITFNQTIKLYGSFRLENPLANDCYLSSQPPYRYICRNIQNVFTNGQIIFNNQNGLNLKLDYQPYNQYPNSYDFERINQNSYGSNYHIVNDTPKTLNSGDYFNLQVDEVSNYQDQSQTIQIDELRMNYNTTKFNINNVQVVKTRNIDYVDLNDVRSNDGLAGNPQINNAKFQFCQSDQTHVFSITSNQIQNGIFSSSPLNLDNVFLETLNGNCNTLDPVTGNTGVLSQLKMSSADIYHGSQSDSKILRQLQISFRSGKSLKLDKNTGSAYTGEGDLIAQKLSYIESSEQVTLINLSMAEVKAFPFNKMKNTQNVWYQQTGCKNNINLSTSDTFNFQASEQEYILSSFKSTMNTNILINTKDNFLLPSQTFQNYNNPSNSDYKITFKTLNVYTNGPFSTITTDTGTSCNIQCSGKSQFKRLASDYTYIKDGASITTNSGSTINLNSTNSIIFKVPDNDDKGLQLDRMDNANYNITFTTYDSATQVVNQIRNKIDTNIQMINSKYTVTNNKILSIPDTIDSLTAYTHTLGSTGSPNALTNTYINGKVMTFNSNNQFNIKGGTTTVVQTDRLEIRKGTTVVTNANNFQITGSTTITIPNPGGSWTQKPSFDPEYNIPHTTLSTVSDSFIKYKCLDMIFTMHNDYSEEIVNKSTNKHNVYYINGTYSDVAQTGTMVTYYANNTRLNSINNWRIKEWTNNILTYDDDQKNSQIMKRESGTNNYYNYDGSKRVTSTQFTFTNGTTINVLSNYNQVSDSFAVRKNYFKNNNYEFTITSPVTEEIYKTQKFNDYLIYLTFKNSTTLQHKTNGEILMTDSNGNTLKELFDFKEVKTQGSIVTTNDILTQVSTVNNGGSISYLMLNGTTYVLTPSEKYTTSDYVETKSGDLSTIVYSGTSRTITKNSLTNEINIISTESSIPQQLKVQSNLITLEVSGTLKYEFGMETSNQNLITTKSGTPTTTTGTFTDVSNVKKLFIDNKNWVELKNDYVYLMTEGEYRIYNLKTGTFGLGDQESFGYLWIKTSTNKIAYIFDGKFYYDNFYYDPVIQKKLINDSGINKIYINNYDTRTEGTTKETFDFSNKVIKFSIKDTTFEPKIDFKGQYSYTKGVYNHLHKYKGFDTTINGSNLEEQIDIIDTKIWSLKNTYPITYQMIKNQYLKEDSADEAIRVYQNPFDLSHHFTQIILSSNTPQYGFTDTFEKVYYMNDPSNRIGFGEKNQNCYLYYVTSRILYLQNPNGTYEYNTSSKKYINQSTSSDYYQKSYQYNSEYYHYNDGTAKKLNGATLLFTVDYERTKSLVEAGNLITKTNTIKDYTHNIHTDTNLEKYTYLNEVTIDIDATKKIYTYTYPTLWTWSKKTPGIKKLIIDKTNDPTITWQLTMRNDDVVNFNVVSDVPQTVGGQSWTSSGNEYSVTLTQNSIQKKLNFKKINNDYIINYNSFLPANDPSKQYHVNIYSLHPELDEFWQEEKTFFTHQYLNQTSYEVNKIDNSNQTAAWYSSSDKKIYANDFTATETSTTQQKTYTNGNTQLWTYSSNLVVLNTPEYDLTTTLNSSNKTTLKTFVYKPAGTDPINKIETINPINNSIISIEQNYLNSTKKTKILAETKTTWLYSNGTEFIETPTTLASHNGQYDYLLKLSANNQFLTFPDASYDHITDTGKLHYVNGSDTSIVTYYDTTPTLLKTATYYNTGSQKGEHQELYPTGNITYFHLNGTIKKTNNKASYYKIYNNAYIPSYPKYEYLFNAAETSIPAGFTAGKVTQVYNNNDKKTVMSNTNYEYLYTNGTKKIVTTDTDGKILSERYEYKTADLTKWSYQIYTYFTNGKLNTVQNVDKNGVKITDYHFENFGDTSKLEYSITTYPQATTLPLNVTQIKNDWSDDSRTISYNIAGNTTSTKIETNCFMTMINPNSTVTLQKVDVERMSNITFTNGTTVFINLTQFLLTGCWYDTQYCIRQKCYYKTKCDCPKNKYCSWNTSTNAHECLDNSNCVDCSNDNKWCQQNDFQGTKYYTCIDEPQDSVAPNNNCTPACNQNEVCVNGKCDYKGTPCFFDADSSFVGVFCLKNQKCVNSKCYTYCQPDCEVTEDCTFNTTQEKFECVEKTSYPQIQSVKTCTLVQNCEVSTKTGECQECKENYSFLRTNKVIDYTNCVLTNVPNCLIGKTVSVGVHTCDDYDDDQTSTLYRSGQKGCKGGHLHQSNQCVKDPSGCKEFNELNQCRYCTTNYEHNGMEVVYSINGPFKKGDCVDKPQDFNLFNPQVNQSEKEQNLHCRYFKLYFKTQSAILPIHDLGLGIDVCFECEDGYYLSDEKFCIQKQINFCKTYDTTITWANRNNQRCAQCEIGYSPQLDASNKIEACNVNLPDEKFRIPKCSKYSATHDCDQCETGYNLYEAKENSYGQKHFCFLETNYNYCKQQDVAYFTSTGKVKCSSCDKINFKFSYPKPLNTEIEQFNTCMYIGTRENCLLHELGEIDDSNLNCIECKPGYYLKKDLKDPANASGQYIQNCSVRTQIYINCQKYFVDQDECETFTESGNSAGTSSTELPSDISILIQSPPPLQLDIQQEIASNWILGCDIYKSVSDCDKCYAHRYRYLEGFENNQKCQKVSRVIKNCRYYNTNQECIKCNDFYYLKFEQCFLLTVENCKVLKDENTCQECPNEYPYLDQEGNCIKHPLNPWCYIYNIPTQQIEFDTRLDCDLCMENFYPDDDGFCRLRTRTIRGCKYYLGEFLCKTCQDGYYLTYDGKQCFKNPNFDLNCQEFNYITTCSICKFGYYLKDKLCVKCDTDVTSCAYCNPDEPTQCLICQFGYTMGIDFSCSKNENSIYKPISQFGFLTSEKIKNSQSRATTIKSNDIYMVFWLTLLNLLLQ